MLFLICASKSNTYMTDVAIDRGAEGGTAQCGPCVARGWAERGGGCLVVVAPVRDVASSSLSIRRGGPDDRPPGRGCRTDGGGDVQASAEPGRRRSGAGGGRRDDDQRHGEPGIAASNSSTPSTVSSP